MQQQLCLRSYVSDSAAHTHDYFQWVLPLTGKLELEIDRRAGYVAAEQAAFIRPGQQHCFASALQNEFLVLDVSASHAWLQHAAIQPFWQLPTLLQQAIQFTKTCVLSADAASTVLAATHLSQWLMQHFLSQQDPRMWRVKTWIDLHFREPIALANVASLCHLSESQLQRRFQHVFGQSVAAYWRQQRLDAAKQLLRSVSLTIDAIAQAVGYDTTAAFSRGFLRAEGMTPTAWRQLACFGQTNAFSGK